MKAYSYNNETMEYICPYDCQLDTVRSAAEGKDIYLLPADATWTAPPEFDQKIQRAIYNPGMDEWTVEEKPEDLLLEEPDKPEVV